MADRAGVEVLEEVRSDYKPSPGYTEAVRDFRRVSPSLDVKKDDVVKLEKILFSVMDWEEENTDKVTPLELDALGIVQQVIGTVDAGIRKKIIGSRESIREARLLQIETQREAVRFLFKNLDQNGNPNEVAVRALSLVSSVFDDHLSPGPDVFFERGLEEELGYWQGVMGMVTAAQMFRSIGWEVRLAPVEFDLKEDVDLLVASKKEEVFTVDVAAKTHGFMQDENLYVVRKVEETHREILEFMGGVAGRIELNVPPLKSSQSVDFYDKSYRRSGTPSQDALNKLKRLLE